MTDDPQRARSGPGVDPSTPPPSFAPRSRAERARADEAAAREAKRSRRAAAKGRPDDRTTPSHRIPAGLGAGSRRGWSRFLPSSPRAVASVLVVTLASGMLFTISAETNRTSAGAPTDTGILSLVRSAQKDVSALDSQVSGLRREVDSYGTSASTEATASVPALATQPVTGPGVTITLTDANLETIPDGATANDLVIHQQDIEDVMNALWNGGAEAMTVQGVRVTGRTVIRCIGNVILVDGESFSPPYVIEAIGDPAQLRAKVDANPRIVNYKAYVALYGLGWDMRTNDKLEIPAATAKTTNSYAQVVD